MEMDIKVLINEEKIKNRIKEIAQEILRDFKNEEIVLICILKGATYLKNWITT